MEYFVVLSNTVLCQEEEILGQLRPFFWVNCAHFVKSWRLSTVILIYMNYNFLICHILWHIRKMLFMLLLNSVQSLTVLKFCAQWMALAALLKQHGGPEYDDLQNWLDKIMMSHENPLCCTFQNSHYILIITGLDLLIYTCLCFVLKMYVVTMAMHKMQR